MTYNPTYDRADWRTMSTRTLIEAARDSGHELAIALGERLEDLEDVADELEGAQAVIRYLQERVNALKEELQSFYDAEAGA